MADHYPRVRLMLKSIATKGLEHFFRYGRQNPDCKSSSTILEFIQKGRKSVQKHYFEQLLNNINSAAEPPQEPLAETAGLYKCVTVVANFDLVS